MKILLFLLIFIFILSLVIFSSFFRDKMELLVAARIKGVEKKKPTATAQTENVNQPQIKKDLSNSAVSRPNIVSRQEWEAKEPLGEAKEHTIRRITIHHTATNQNEKIAIERKMQNLQNFSRSESRLASGKMKPAWFDVPYHYYIAVDGKIAEGREIKFVGDTNTDYDPTGHALIVLEGNFQTEQPSFKQQEALQELAAWLSARWKVRSSEIKAHNDYASTACPGENLKKLLPSLRQKVDETISASEKR